ncbi:MAG TPA: PA2169 family four-helix-bundle protein [Rickettsia endosymbiont of Bembidion lapponicum]|nr:PA2169 family four-helix-bundle protein [Rickettsia endosymbiont of Bembidion lapponicum]
MTTLVGIQNNFVDAIKELIELDYDAIEAYEAAINRITDENYKIQLQRFKEDHERHVKELNELLSKHKEDEITGPSSKQWLTKGKVVLATQIGDRAILHAMLSNEEDTNTAYERLNNHADKWHNAEKVLEQGFKDEQKHKKWIEKQLND